MANEITPTPLSPSERMEQIKREADAKLTVLDLMRNGQPVNTNESILDYKSNVIPQDTVQKIIDRVKKVADSAEHHEVNDKQLQLQAIAIVTQETLGNKFGQELAVLEQQQDREDIRKEIERLTEARDRKIAERERLLNNLGRATKPTPDTPPFLNAVQSAHPNTPDLGVPVNLAAEHLDEASLEITLKAEEIWSIINRQDVQLESKMHMLALLDPAIEQVITGSEKYISTEMRDAYRTVSAMRRPHKDGGTFFPTEFESSFVGAFLDLVDHAGLAEITDVLGLVDRSWDGPFLDAVLGKLHDAQSGIFTAVLHKKDDISLQKCGRWWDIYKGIIELRGRDVYDRRMMKLPPSPLQMEAIAQQFGTYYDYVVDLIDKEVLPITLRPLVEAVRNGFEKGQYVHVLDAQHDIDAFVHRNSADDITLFGHSDKDLAKLGITPEVLSKYYDIDRFKKSDIEEIPGQESDSQPVTMHELTANLYRALVSVVEKDLAKSVTAHVLDRMFSPLNQSSESLDLSIAERLPQLSPTERMKIRAYVHSYQAYIKGLSLMTRDEISIAMREATAADPSKQKDGLGEALFNVAKRNDSRITERTITSLTAAIDHYLAIYGGSQTSPYKQRADFINKFRKYLESSEKNPVSRTISHRVNKFVRALDNDLTIDREIMRGLLRDLSSVYLIDAYLWGLQPNREFSGPSKAPVEISDAIPVLPPGYVPLPDSLRQGTSNFTRKLNDNGDPLSPNEKLL